MKKIIRKGVFESNSSSTHAIAICKDSDILIPAELYFGFGEHGWENETLHTPEEKANYLHTAIACIYKRKGYTDIINHIFSVLLAYDCEATFETPKWDEWNGDGYLDMCQGYIDHYSDGELGDFVKKVLKNDKLLYNYLFSEKSFVVKGNDNDYIDTYEIVDSYEADYKFYKGN